MDKTEITMLNSMASLDFIESLDQQLKWGIKMLDLKDNIYGKALMDLSDEEAMEAAKNIKSRDMTVYCLSTTLFFDDIELGEEVFRKNSLQKIDRILELANILKPQVIRFLSPRTNRRQEFINILPYIKEQHKWLIPMYIEAIDKIYEAGYKATIENEANGCILSKPDEILGLFKAFNRNEKVFFTFDIQNLWQMGTYPSVEVYEMLSDITGYFHLKGSQSLVPGGRTHYGTTLEDASWPVVEVTKKAVTEGKGIVICLNPIKGEKINGYDYEAITKRDLDYLRNTIEEVR
jgi:hypothetical protein